MKQNIYLSLFLSLIFSLGAAAQMPGARPGGMGQNMNMGHFYGKLIDESNLKPVDGASVQLIQNKMDTNTKKRRDYILATLLSDKKGEFSIESVPVMGSFRLRISAVGYKQREEKVGFELNMGAARTGDMSSMMNAVDKDLGNFKLTQDTKQLQDVTVTASKPLLQMNLDRKVYNVEKDLSAAGGTAVDIMKNVPSVNVDIDGNVSLRNAAPQIFIDGRPTTLTLDQIPADQIASVEIITNPSAKYDASGGGSGILNIVLKKNRKAGYNGNIRASIDSRGRPGGGGDINIKQNKINLFAAAMIGMPRSLSTAHTERIDYLRPDTIAKLVQDNDPEFKGVFGFGRLGLDYFLDNRNTFTLSGNYVKRKFNSNDIINTTEDLIGGNTILETKTGARTSESESKGYNYGSTLGFKHNYAKTGKELTADINYNYSNNENMAIFDSRYNFKFSPSGNYQNIQKTLSAGNTNFLTVQTDYVNPLTKTSKLEMGLRLSRRNFESANDNFTQDLTSKQYILDPNLSVKYKFTDEVYAGYTTYSRQLKKFSYQLGLRLESSKYDGDFISKNQGFSNRYPFSLFPSTYLTYKLTEKQDLQLNYSRKINRPNFFQLIPFIDYTDSLNLSIGNPDLRPEFTNLIEIGYANQYSAGNSFFASLYGRNTNDLITRYTYRTSNPDTAKKNDVLFTSYANATRSYTFGLELTGKNKIAKWWDLTTNFNFFNSTIEASNLIGTGDNSQFSWFGKINNSFKLPKKFSIQLTADYQAKTLLPASSGGARGGGGGGGMFGGGGGGFGQSQSSAQGYIKPVYGADLSIRKDFMKNNVASLTLQFNDIFRSRIYASHSESIFFVQDNSRRRDPQVVRLNFNWRFGKFDVALFKRKNMKGEMESMQGIQQGPAQ
ncbi:MAG: outer membrane beta-barrel family protein [Ferruginibacter sp.]